jgi:signal peptidase I
MNPEKTPNTTNWRKDMLELVRFMVTVMIIIVPIRMFIAQPFIVNGESMDPTFKNGDYLIIDEISYTLGKPIERGDVIVFRFPTDNKRFLIKRVIGLPGETISINGHTVVVRNKLNETVLELKEDYLVKEFSSYGEWTLEDDEYFVMGDNRQASSDSRSWGLLKRELIVGKTFLRLFPLSKVGYQPGEYQSENIEKIMPSSN